MSDNVFANHRHANQVWDVSDHNGKVANWHRVDTAVLMDIRAELRKLNAVFECQNFLDVPNLLRRIDKNTRKPKRKVAKP